MKFSSRSRIFFRVVILFVILCFEINSVEGDPMGWGWRRVPARPKPKPSVENKALLILMKMLEIKKKTMMGKLKMAMDLKPVLLTMGKSTLGLAAMLMTEKVELLKLFDPVELNEHFLGHALGFFPTPKPTPKPKPMGWGGPRPRAPMEWTRVRPPANYGWSHYPPVAYTSYPMGNGNYEEESGWEENDVHMRNEENPDWSDWSNSEQAREIEIDEDENDESESQDSKNNEKESEESELIPEFIPFPIDDDELKEAAASISASRDVSQGEVLNRLFAFLSTFDNETCLQKLVCDIHAREGNSKTELENTNEDDEESEDEIQNELRLEYETNILKLFRILKKSSKKDTKIFKKNAAKYLKAAQRGTDSGSVETCAIKYPICEYSSNEIIDMNISIK